ncbi:MAG: alpha/beta hydrolase [Saprospiraceae bacterium]|nr:alpha/beta hydrolase [Saprospiraceae bacterium]
MASNIKIENIKANGFEFTCRTIGTPSSGKNIILLHGFPETSMMWEETMIHLHEHGYYCIAPDMRGYSPKARPKGVKNYAIRDIAKDIIMISKVKGLDEFHLIGHDWGAAIGWAIVGLYPNKITTWLAMSVGHLIPLAKATKYDPAQKKMSAYARAFQLRLLPELVLKGNNFKRLRKECWYLCDNNEIKAYISVLNQPKALTSALHYYRKNWKNMLSIAESLNIKAIETPTTLIWGNKDVALGRKAIIESEQYMKGPYKLVELDASHWLIQEAKESVWETILEHLKNN